MCNGSIYNYFGWDGREDIDAANNILEVLYELKHAGIDGDILIDLNDSGFTFNRIADYFDQATNTKTW